MTNEQTREQFLLALNSNAYIGMCEVDDMQNAINALEKQIPKKVVYHDDSGNKTVSERCPICFEIAHSDYCEYCGQALDWEEGGTSD